MRITIKRGGGEWSTGTGAAGSTEAICAHGCLTAGAATPAAAAGALWCRTTTARAGWTVEAQQHEACRNAPEPCETQWDSATGGA